MNGFGPAADAEWCLELPRNPAAAGEARQSVGQLLDESQATVEATESAQLVASELVTNALQHGEGPIELRLKLMERFLRIEVVDDGHGQAPAVRTEPPDESGGWGLRIVDSLAAQWGVFEGTTHVWADVDLG